MNLLSNNYYVGGTGRRTCLQAFHEIEEATFVKNMDLSIVNVLSVICDNGGGLASAALLSEESELKVEKGRFYLEADIVNIRTFGECDALKYPVFVDGWIEKTPISLNDDNVYLTSSTLMKHITKLCRLGSTGGGFFRDSLIASRFGNMTDEFPVTMVCRKDVSGIKRAVGCFVNGAPEMIGIDEVCMAVSRMNENIICPYEIREWKLDNKIRSVTLSDFIHTDITVSWSDTGYLSLTVQSGKTVLHPKRAELGKILEKIACEREARTQTMIQTFTLDINALTNTPKKTGNTFAELACTGHK